MKQPIKNKLFPLLLGAALLLSGCQSNGGSEPEPRQSGEVDTRNSTASTAVIDVSSLFSERDLAGAYDESEAIPIYLEGDAAACDSDAVTVEDGQVIISAEGVYLITGTLTDGQIVVNAPDTDKVQLVLAGAEINSETSAAIYALEADKVFLTLAEGTENSLSNGGEYTAIDENNIDAVVFAKTDLTLNGAGSLTISAAAGHGVVSKDDLVITGGDYTVTAASHGMTGKDVLAIADGTFHITSGKDSLRAENADDASLGSLYIADGDFTIDAQGDAVSASGAMQIDGGTVSITTGAGSASVVMTASDSFGPGRPDQGENTGTDETGDTVSQKGLKADGTLAINGGVFLIDSADDCLHAGGNIAIAAGDFTLNSGDDALHSDSAVSIQDGTFSIPCCYEGIEGMSITIDGGAFDITAYDDGLNAAGGADGSGFGMRQDQFTSGSDYFITINGGTFTIVSQGDCIDSNGNLTINGGTLDLTCNGNGDTAVDADGTYTNNGGELTTNDGSENNVGGMGGHGGGAGKLPKEGEEQLQGDEEPPDGRPDDTQPQTGGQANPASNSPAK